MTDLTLDFLGGATIMVIAEMEELGWIEVDLDAENKRVVTVTELGASHGLDIATDGSIIDHKGVVDAVADLAKAHFAEFPKP